MPTRRNTHMQSRAPTTTRRTEARTMVILHATAPIKPEAREQWFAHLGAFFREESRLTQTTCDGAAGSSAVQPDRLAT